MNPQKPNNMVNSSSSWLFPQTRLTFFSRIRRRLLHSKTGATKHRPGQTSDSTDKPINIGLSTVQNMATEEQQQKHAENEPSTGTEMQTAVKKLHFGNLEEKAAAAEEIRRLAGEDDKVRKALVELGVVPALVSMVDSEVVIRRRSALRALTQLANGTFTHKILIVEAGLLSKLPRNAEATDESIALEFSQLLHSLSFLSNAQFQLSPSHTLPFLVTILESSTASFDTKTLCVATLYNQSTALENATTLVANGAVPVLLRMSTVKEASEKALAALGNLGVTLAGKKALECDQMVPESLIEVLTWEDKPKCQELCAYLLMVLAHQSSVQRDKMAKSGIVAVLLEAALLGSPLVQKRALKLLQWFKDERQVKIGPHSGPQTSPITIGSPLSLMRQGDTGEAKKMMKDLVRQSLYKNMEVITQRADDNKAHKSCKVKALDLSSRSKSLPYY